MDDAPENVFEKCIKFSLDQILGNPINTKPVKPLNKTPQEKMSYGHGYNDDTERGGISES